VKAAVRRRSGGAPTATDAGAGQNGGCWAEVRGLSGGGGSPQADGAPWASAPAQAHPHSPCDARDHTEFTVKHQLLQEGERSDKEHEGDATAEAPWIRPWIPHAQQPVVAADRPYPSQVRGVKERRVETACGVRGWAAVDTAEARA
jgi:hypothetical protein